MSSVRYSNYARHHSALTLAFIALILTPLTTAKGVPAFGQVGGGRTIRRNARRTRSWECSRGIQPASARLKPIPNRGYRTSLRDRCVRLPDLTGLWICPAFARTRGYRDRVAHENVRKLPGLATLCAIACLSRQTRVAEQGARRTSALHFFLCRTAVFSGCDPGRANAQPSADPRHVARSCKCSATILLLRNPSWRPRSGLQNGARVVRTDRYCRILDSPVFYDAAMVLAATHPDSAAGFSTYRPVIHWEESQSVPLLQAARFLGYIGGYDAALSGWIKRCWTLARAWRSTRRRCSVPDDCG